MKNKYIDFTQIKPQQDLVLYKPKVNKLNFCLGFVICVYAILPLFSLWLLPIGLMIMFNSIPLKYLIKNRSWRR